MLSLSHSHGCIITQLAPYPRTFPRRGALDALFELDSGSGITLLQNSDDPEFREIHIRRGQGSLKEVPTKERPDDC